MDSVALRTLCDDHKQALEYKLKQIAENGRQQYHQVRYLIDKRIKVLQGGKHGNGLAKVMGHQLFQLCEALTANPDDCSVCIPSDEQGKPIGDLDPEHFDHKRFALYTAADSVFAKTMLKYQHEAPTTIESVASALEEDLDENKTWPGAVALVPSQQKDFDFHMGERFESIDCPGASP